MDLRDEDHRADAPTGGPMTAFGPALVVRVGGGDRAAFDELYASWTPRLVGWYRLRGLADDAAEELAQDVMVTVWNTAARYDPAIASPHAWLFTIARNRMIDRHRRDRRAEVDPGDPMFVADPAAAPDALAASRRTAEVVRGALDALPPEQREVLVAGQLSGRSLAEVAATSGLPLGTVKTRARLALDRLRRALVGEA